MTVKVLGFDYQDTQLLVRLSPIEDWKSYDDLEVQEQIQEYVFNYQFYIFATPTAIDYMYSKIHESDCPNVVYSTLSQDLIAYFGVVTTSHPGTQPMLFSESEMTNFKSGLKLTSDIRCDSIFARWIAHGMPDIYTIESLVDRTRKSKPIVIEEIMQILADGEYNKLRDYDFRTCQNFSKIMEITTKYHESNPVWTMYYKQGTTSEIDSQLLKAVASKLLGATWFDVELTAKQDGKDNN